MRNLLLIIFSILLLAACTNSALRTQHSQLAKADSLMHTHPDSALALLQSISADSLTDDANRAYHALLLSQALDKNYIDKTDDSLINIAVAYYADKPVTPQQMLAYYYQARIKQNAKAYPEALYSALHAEATALQLNDHYHLGLIYRLMMECYNQTYKFEKQLHYAQLSYSHFEQTPNIRYLLFAKLMVANAYMACELFDDALFILPSLITQAENMNDTILLSNTLDCYSHTLTLSENYNLAKKQLLRLDSFSRYRWNSFNYADFITIYYHEQKLDSMQYYYEHLKNTIKNEEDKYLASKASELIAIQMGNHKIAYEKSTIKHAIKDSILQQATLVSLPVKQLEYRMETETQTSTQQKQQLVIFIIVLFIVLLLFGVLFRRHQQKKKAEIIQLLLSLQRSEEQCAHQRHLLESTTHSEVKSIIKLLSKPYSFYLESIKDGDVNFKELKQQINSIIARLRNREYVKELENTINKNQSNLMHRIKKELSLNENDYTLCIYLLAGYPNNLVAYIMNATPNTIYQRKYRIKEKIASTDFENKETLCDLLS